MLTIVCYYHLLLVILRHKITCYRCETLVHHGNILGSSRGCENINVCYSNVDDLYQLLIVILFFKHDPSH